MTTEWLKPALIVGGVTIIASYLARQALTSRAYQGRDGTRVLKYPRVYRTLGTLGSAGIVALAVAMPTMAAAEPQTLGSYTFLAIVGVGVGALGVYGCLEFPFVRLEMSEAGLRSFTPWRGTREIPWRDIVAVTFSEKAKWLI